MSLIKTNIGHTFQFIILFTLTLNLSSSDKTWINQARAGSNQLSLGNNIERRHIDAALGLSRGNDEGSVIDKQLLQNFQKSLKVGAGLEKGKPLGRKNIKVRHIAPDLNKSLLWTKGTQEYMERCLKPLQSENIAKYYQVSDLQNLKQNACKNKKN